MILRPLGPRLGKRPGRPRRGQATVEFAFAGITFFMLLFGIVAMALVILAYNAISFAASEGARYGSALPTTSQNATTGTPAVQGVVEAAAANLNLAAANVAVSWPEDPLLNDGRLDVSVTVTYSYVLTVPGIGSFTLPLTSTAEMMCSN